MKESKQSEGVQEAESIVHQYEARLLTTVLVHSSFAAALLQSNLAVASDRILINCSNRVVADVWCDKCEELCQIVVDTLKLPLRVVVSWLGCGNLQYDIPTHKILKMSLSSENDTERSFRVLERLVSGKEDREDRKLLDEVMNEDEARCLVELESDRPIICNSKLATLVQQSAAEWRRTDLRRHWADNPQEFQDQVDEAPDYLKQVKQELEKRKSLIISYETWLTDDIFGVFESEFVRTTFQCTLSRAVTIYHFDSCVAPAFA